MCGIYWQPWSLSKESGFARDDLISCSSTGTGPLLQLYTDLHYLKGTFLLQYSS